MRSRNRAVDWLRPALAGINDDLMGALKMRDWKMRDWKIREQETYGTPRVA